MTRRKLAVPHGISSPWDWLAPWDWLVFLSVSVGARKPSNSSRLMFSVCEAPLPNMLSGAT